MITSMEFVDSLDITTPIDAGWIGIESLYIWRRPCIHPSDNSYTDEVAGSSPVTPTYVPPGMGVIEVRILTLTYFWCRSGAVLQVLPARPFSEQDLHPSLG